MTDRIHEEESDELDDSCSEEPRGLWIPAAGNTTGLNGTLWNTDLEFQGLSFTTDNPNDSSVKIALFKHGVANTHPAMAEIEVDRHFFATTRIENVLDSVFDHEGSAALHLEIRGGSLNVSSRTFNIGDDGTFGQVIPAIPASEAAQNLVLPNLRHAPGEWRTNIGLINPSGYPKVVSIVLLGGGMWVSEIRLGPFEYRQINEVFAGKHTNENVTAHLYSETGPILAYGSVIDSRTGDATFVTARPLPASMQ